MAQHSKYLLRRSHRAALSRRCACQRCARPFDSMRSDALAGLRGGTCKPAHKCAPTRAAMATDRHCLVKRAGQAIEQRASQAQRGCLQGGHGCGRSRPCVCARCGQRRARGRKSAARGTSRWHSQGRPLVSMSSGRGRPAVVCCWQARSCEQVRPPGLSLRTSLHARRGAGADTQRSAGRWTQ